MLFGNTLHIGHKGLETLSVWNVPTAVPPLEVVRSTVNIVGQRCVRVDFHDAVSNMSLFGEERSIDLRGRFLRFLNPDPIALQDSIRPVQEANSVGHVRCALPRHLVLAKTT